MQTAKTMIRLGSVKMAGNHLYGNINGHSVLLLIPKYVIGSFFIIFNALCHCQHFSVMSGQVFLG